MPQLPDFKRVDECRGGAWEAIGPFVNLADPNYVQYFRETMMKAFQTGADKIRYHTKKRKDDEKYVAAIRQQF